ncbi:hypothetical protein C2G38_2206620 [Gigaspora rosea]|uniref:Restriction endonuclease type IV Mrr domain-containing protein n=1 Tax=Gigaspora rosea TaxID=44941 RepID=A0A397UL94_9GLOM|nr:hypothetical protein C2G38_2206620 [Gigaspora rosea]
MFAKHLLKNNLQQLYITHNGFNFYVNYYTKIIKQYVFEKVLESLVDLQLESPTSVLSNSTYITDDRFVDKEETKKKIIITNYASGHNFENIIRKFLNSYNILANEIKVTQGDDGIDIIATYQNNIVLIQCKNIESAISVKIIREFESSVSRYPNSLGIIVYNSEKIKEISSHQKLKFGIKPEEKDYIITNYKADEFNLEEFGITSKNVSIEQMVIKKNIVPRAITFAGTIGSGKTTCAKIFEKFLKDNGYKVKRIIEVSMQIPDALNLFYKTKNGLFFQQINELEDHHYILIDRGFKEIEIFTDLIIKDEKSKECLKKQRDLIALKLQNDIIFVNPTKKKQLLKERKQETDFGKNVTKIIYQNYMINMKIIVAKYKKESPMLDYLFKQQAEKLQEEIKDIEEYECHKRIIKELIEGQDIDIVIVKYSIKFTHWAETIEGIKGIAEAIKNIKDNNKFKN